jgi:hypothetical protein
MVSSLPILIRITFGVRKIIGARRNGLTWRLYETIMGSSLTIPVGYARSFCHARTLTLNPMKDYTAELAHLGFNKWWITCQNLQVIADSGLKQQFLLLLSSSSSGLLDVSFVILQTTRCFVRATPCFFIPRTKHTNQTRNPSHPQPRPPLAPTHLTPHNKACHCCFL